MKKLVLLAFAFLSVPAFANLDHHQGHDCHHGRDFHHRGWGTGNDRAIGPARGAYNLNSRGASCEGARSMVGARGAVIVYFGDGLYDRVVRDGSFCAHDQYTQPFWAEGCFVGYTCRENDGD